MVHFLRLNAMVSVQREEEKERGFWPGLRARGSLHIESLRRCCLSQRLLSETPCFDAAMATIAANPFVPLVSFFVDEEYLDHSPRTRSPFFGAYWWSSEKVTLQKSQWRA